MKVLKSPNMTKQVPTLGTVQTRSARTIAGVARSLARTAKSRHPQTLRLNKKHLFEVKKDVLFSINLNFCYLFAQYEREKR